MITGDLGDPAILSAAVEDVDAVLHLACRHGEALGFEDTLETNYRATLALFEAAIANGANHIVFASSNHGWGFYNRADAPLGTEAPPRPDSWYGISKVWTEAVLAFLADSRGIKATSLRIGRCEAVVPDERCQHMWISFDDLARLIECALGRTSQGHYACFATADCRTPFFDNSAARALGFVSQDSPHDHFSEPRIAALAPDQGPAGHYLGGSYAAENLTRAIVT